MDDCTNSPHALENITIDPDEEPTYRCHYCGRMFDTDD